MPSYTRMKRIFLDGLLWLFLFQYGIMVLSLESGFLDFDNLPDTNFTCVGKVIGGYYADLETNCQMFHVCTIGQADEPMDIRFLCLNGTVFDQETRVCERIDEVDCTKSEQFYSLNLELYGNSGPILEETPDVPQETETPSIIIKSTTPPTTTTPTTTTSTTTRRPTTKPTNPPYYTTIRPSTATTSISQIQALSGHHFPVNNADIRFNPEEINISLNPGAPPDIRTKHFQLHQNFGDGGQLSVSSDSDNDEQQSVRVQKPDRVRLSSATSPKSIFDIEIGDSDKLPNNSDDNFGFSGEGFQGTELPRHQQFLIQTNNFRHSQSFPPNGNHNSHQYHHPQFHSTTVKASNFQPSHTTVRNFYIHSLKPPEVHQHHHYTHHPRTEKTPQRVQIPIPILPTLPPLTFSSPAPFTLQRHIETKRYTKDHQAPPRIVISASASVSDASGRRLNYSLGTIGAAQILDAPPSSYDEYKDSDVGLDPFYHDVPKLKQGKRKRRSLVERPLNPFDIIKNEKEAVEVLKFLFTWYQSHQATASVSPVTSPVSADLIQEINHKLAPEVDDSTLKTDSSEYQFTNAREPSSTESLRPGNEDSELFKQNGSYSILGGYRNEHPKLNESEADKNSSKANRFTSDKFENPNVTHNENEADKNVSKSSPLFNEKFKNSNESEADKVNENPVEISEKMDNADMTVIEDVKKFSFNPDDYIDDNYEGAVYKTNSDAKSRESEKSNQEEKVIVDPDTISELYKYFSINRPTLEPNIAEESSSTEHPLSSYDNNSNNLRSSGQHTEINVLSEVSEHDGISSSTTSTVTSTKTSARRRGRGRQRQIDSDQEASFKSTQEAHNNYIPTSSRRTKAKRGKSRNRSRSSTTTTTTTVDSEATLPPSYDATMTLNLPTESPVEATSSDSPEASQVKLLKNDVPEADHTEQISKLLKFDLRDGIDLAATAELTENNKDDNAEYTRRTNAKRGKSRNRSRSSTTTTTVTVDPQATSPQSYAAIVALNVPTEFPVEATSSDSPVATEVKLLNNYIPESNHTEQIGKLLQPVLSDGIKIAATAELTENNEHPINIVNEAEHTKKTNAKRGKTRNRFRSSSKYTSSTTSAATVDPQTILPPSYTATVASNLPTELPVEYTTNDLPEVIEVKLLNNDIPEADSTERIGASPELAEATRRTNAKRSKSRNRSRSSSKYYSSTTTAATVDPLATSTPSYTATVASNLPTEFPAEVTTIDSPEVTEVKLLKTNIPDDADHSELVAKLLQSDLSEGIKIAVAAEITENNGHTVNITDEVEHAEGISKLLQSDVSDDTKTAELTEIDQTLITADEDEHAINNASNTKSELTDGKKVGLTDIINSLNTSGDSYYENKTVTDNNDVVAIIYDNIITTESFTEPTSTSKEVEDDPDDPSYLIKLLKYFADNAAHEVATTEHPEASYDPLTENQVSSTPYSINSKPNRYRHSSRVTTTGLPTLRGISEGAKPLRSEDSLATTTGVTGKLSNLLEKLSIINKHLADMTVITDSPIADTTATTPLVRYEERESFGTSFPTVTEPTASQELTRMFDVSTASAHYKSYNSLYDDLFTVPELTGEGSAYGGEEESKEATTKSVSEDTSQLPPSYSTPIVEYTTESVTISTSTTVVPDVEIQKSISLPISILDNSFNSHFDINHAQDINGLASTDGKSTTILDIPTTEIVNNTITENYGNTITESVSTSTGASTNGPEVRQNATEIIFLKSTEGIHPTAPVVPVEAPQALNSSHLVQVIVETNTNEPIATTMAPNNSKARPTRRRPSNKNRSQFGRHRFSTELFTNKPPKHEEFQYKQNLFAKENITDAPLHRSATPTRSELKKVLLHTTPLSSKTSRLPTKVGKHYVFNCFGKDKNRFYADPRDCRLFHYCTQGYSKNQLLDLKYVCDQKTFFDEEKLICTRQKPARCL